MTRTTKSQRNHLWAWAVIPFFAIANGALREGTYGRVLPAALSHSISVFPLLAIIVAFAVFLAHRWPLPDARAGVRVGGIWLGLTLAFEFGMGFAIGTPLRQMLAQYNVFAGNLWPVIPLCMALAPEGIRRMQQRHPHWAPAQ